MRALLIVALVVGCSGARTPADYSKSASFGEPEHGVPVGEVPIHGSHVDIELEAQTYSGELLAVDRERVYLLTDKGQRVGIHHKFIRLVDIHLYPSSGGLYGLWGGVGTLSTLSHGFFLVFSAPIWLGVTIPVAIGEGASSKLRFRGGYSQMFPFARWPQGMPKAQ